MSGKSISKTKLSELKKITPKSGDDIENLPTDDSLLSYKERTIIDSLYPDQAPSEIFPESSVVDDSSTIKAKCINIKEICILIILFVVLNLPFIDTVLFSYIENPYYRVLTKSVIFGIIFYVFSVFVL